MALTINKPDARGKQQVVSTEDLYLDNSGKVLVVKEGKEVPKEAASVLAMRGGRVPARYAKMVEEAGVEVKPEVEVKAQAKAKPPSEASATNPASPVNVKKTEEKPVA
jgi:hypothetical protein